MVVESIVMELLYTKVLLYFISTLKGMRGIGLLAFLLTMGRGIYPCIYSLLYVILITMKYKKIDIKNNTIKLTIQLWKTSGAYSIGITIYKKLQTTFLLKYFEEIRRDRLISFPYYYTK